MRPRALCWTLAAAVILAGPIALAADSGWLLRTTLNEGDTHRFALTHSQSMTLEMGGVNQRMENSSRMEFVQTVKSRLGDDALLLDVVYERMQSEMIVGEMALKFDTADAKPSPHPMARMQQYLIGRHFTVTMSSRGEVQEIQGFDAILDDMSTAFADDPSLARTMEAIKSGFGSEAMTGMMQQGIVVYPKHKVATGDTWQHRVMMPNPALGELNLTSEYEVLGSERIGDRDHVKLGVASTIEFGNQGQMFNQLQQLLGGEIEVDIDDASGSGSVVVDSTTGIVVSSELQQRIVMDISMKLPEGTTPTTNVAIRGAVAQQIGLELLE